MRRMTRRARFGTVSAALCLALHLPAPAADSDAKLAAPAPIPAGELRLPPPVVFAKTVGPERAVSFRHETHLDLAPGSCLACHPEPFRLVRPTRAATHADMDAGRSCGSCHDGKKAFGTRDERECAVCHAGPAEPGAGARDATFRSSSASPGAVTFRHAGHSFGSCAPCHPSPFVARAGGTRVSSPADFHAKCGSCHDGSAAFGVEDPDACARCHAAEGAGS